MDANTVAAELAKPIAQELLGSAIPARLAYLGTDGDPRVVPVGFLWKDATVVIGAVPASAKVGALRKNPRVALTIDTEGFPPRVLLIRGTATVEVVDGVPDDYIAASRKLVPEAGFAEWEAGVRALFRQTALITIVPDWAKVLDFETTVPKALADLAADKQ
ncbi:MAG TPA: pyridoxamine 5'-phosphate oxidase family protein [Pseudonocardia sp.]